MPIGISIAISGVVTVTQTIAEAVAKAGYKLGTDIALALDVASTEFYSEATGKYTFEGQERTSDEMIARIRPNKTDMRNP